jgi:hypothetical protein
MHKFKYVQRMYGKGKGKAIHYRPWRALSVPGGWGSQISWQSAHEGDKFVSSTHWPSLPPGNIPFTHFCHRQRATVQSEGLCQWKIPVTPLGIEPGTFRFVAQCWKPNTVCRVLMYLVPFYIQVNIAYYTCEQQCCPWSYTPLVNEQCPQ